MGSLREGLAVAVIQQVQTPGLSVFSMTMLLLFAVSFDFILPVNSPQGMDGAAQRRAHARRARPVSGCASTIAKRPKIVGKIGFECCS